jgi:poly(A) polymerase
MTETFQAELELHKIDCLASHKKLDNYRFMTKKLKEVQKESQKGKLPLSGEDLLRLGFKPGPIIGQILHEAQDEWLEGRIKTHDEALQFVKKHFKIPSNKT